MAGGNMIILNAGWMWDCLEFSHALPIERVRSQIRDKGLHLKGNTKGISYLFFT
jgi:hypothetical protein